MKLISLKCPYCGSNLEIEDGLDTFFCKYCGGKIFMDGLTKEAYQARVRVKEMDHTERLKDKDVDLEKYLAKQKAKTDKWGRIETIVIMIVFAVMFLAYISLAFIFKDQ